MSHPFRSEAAAAVAENFEHWGEAAVFKPADGGAIETRAIDHTADVITLSPRHRTRQTGRTLDLPREIVTQRPGKGDTVVVGQLTYTILEEAVSDDALGLVWSCRVSLVIGRTASLAFLLAPPLCTAGAELGPRPNNASTSLTLVAPVVFATVFVPVIAQAAAIIPAPTVVAAAFRADSGGAMVDIMLPAPHVVASAAAPCLAAAEILIPAPGVAALAAIAVVSSDAVTLPAPQASAAAAAGIAAEATFALPAPAVTATALAPVAAALDVNLPAPSVAANAVLSGGPVAEANIVLPAPAVTAAATAAVDATAAVSVPAPSTAASARVGVMPYAGVTLPAPAVIATAAVALAGEGAASLPAPAITASAQAAVTTIDAVVIPAPQVAAAASLSTTAALAVMLPAPAVTAAAAVALAPAALANVPAPVAASTALATIAALANITLGPPGVVATAEVVDGAPSGGIGAPSYMGATVNNSGSTGAKPAETVEGDYLLAWAAIEWTAGGNVSTPSGWSLIGSSRALASAGHQVFAFGRRVGAADGSSYTFTGATRVVIERWINVDPTTPVNAVNAAMADDWGGAAANVNPGVTTTLNGCAITGAFWGNQISETYPSRTVARGEFGDSAMGRRFTRVQASAGASGSFTVQRVGTSPWVSLVVALNGVAGSLTAPDAFDGGMGWVQGTSLSLTRPAWVREGDVVFAILTNYGGTAAITAVPAGFTLLDSYGGNGTTFVYRKVAGASEPATYNFTATAESYAQLQIVGGVDPVAPIDAAPVKASGTGAARTSPGVTTTKACAVVLLVSHGAEVAAASGGQGFLNLNNWGRCVTIQKTVQTAGVSGALSVPQAASGAWGSMAFALAPLAG